MIPTPFTARVISHEYIAKETRKTIFEISDSSFSFSTGQFVNILLTDSEGKKAMRAYSIASSSSHLPQFELCVKVIENGLGSGFIDRLTVGDDVDFMGPFGHFGQKFPEKKIMMVATGTGIAPMKAIVDELSEKNFPTQTTLVFGVREEEYAFYREYFEELDEKFLDFSFHLYVSRPSDDFSEKGCAKKGRVTEIFSEISGFSDADFEDSEFLICGNPAMVKEVRKTLREEKNVDKKLICVEAY